MLGVHGIGKIDSFTDGSADVNVVIHANGNVNSEQRVVCDWMKSAGAALIGESLATKRICDTVRIAALDRIEAASGVDSLPCPMAQPPLRPEGIMPCLLASLTQKFSGLNIRLFGGLAIAILSEVRVSDQA